MWKLKFPLSELLQGFCFASFFAGLFIVIVFNLFLFPDCNRINRDCFLIHHMWGESQ